MTKIGSLFLLLWMNWAFAEVTVQSIVDRNQVPMGETLTVTVTIQSEGNVELQEPKVPQLDGFDLLNTWTSSSTSSRLVQTSSGMDFQTTRRKEYNFMLSPQRKGNLDIGGFEVNVEGKIYRTKPIRVEVIGSGGAIAAKPQKNQAEDRFAQLLQERAQQGKGYRSMPRNTNEAFFIQVEVDKTEAYAGEQILAKWYIYSRGQVEHIDRLKFPTLRGFWKEDIEAAPSLNFRQEVINGIVYRKALLASHALFPINAGTAVIDEYKVKAVVRMATGNFGLFAFGRPYSYTKSSERLKVKVRELPTNAPSNFSGAVGKFDVGTVVEGREFPVNQPFTLKIRFEGQGNAKLIDLPPIDFPNQLELYDTKQEAKFFQNGTSFKDFELLLIPREQGVVTVPGIQASIFNPDTGQYETKVTEPVTVKIVPGKDQQQIAGQNFGDTKIETQKVEKKDVFPSIKIKRESSSMWTTQAQAMTWAGVYLALALVLGLKARSELGWGKRKYDLNKIVDERFQSVRKKIDSDQWRSSGTEMTNVTYAVLGEMAGLGGASEEVGRIIDKLPPSVRRELGESIQKNVDQIQILSFAPEAVVGDLKKPENLKQLAKKVQADLKSAIKLFDKSDTTTG